MSKRVGHAPAITSEQTWGDWYNDHRLLLNPFAVGLTLGVFGVLDALLVPFWWETVAIIGAAALAVFVWTAGLLKHGQRVYYRMIIFVGVLWFCALHTPLAAEHVLGFAVAWLSATLLLGMGYWNDQRERKRIELDNELKMWPAKAKKIGIPLARITVWTRTATGRYRDLWWDDGDYTTEQIKGLKAKIEATLGVPRGQLRILDVKDGNDNINSNRVRLSENTESAARKEPVPFTEPTMRSICDPMLVGPFEDGEPCEVFWYKQGFGGTHTLAAGATRSGKSGLYHLMLAETADCNDVARLGIDAKGGMALRPWAPMFEWLVCGRGAAAADETAAMLEWLNAVMIARENYAGERGWDVWRVSRKHPLIILYVDEAAEVFAMKLENFAALEMVEKIGRMGAGVGVLLCAATQYPTLEAIGSSQVQANILRRFCFRVERKAHQHVILPNALEVDATFPDKPGGDKGAGWCLLSDMGTMSALPLRVRNVDRAGIFEIVESYWTRKCPLDAVSAGVPTRRAEYLARKIWTPDDIRPRSDDDFEAWKDELEETDDGGVDPVTEGTGAGTAGGESVGDKAGTPSGNPVGNDGEEQVMAATGTTEDQGMSIMDLVRPRTADAAATFAAAQAAWNAEHEEWSKERATAEFWKAFQLAGSNGVRVSKLATLCHRSDTWAHNLRREAQEALAIVPVATGSQFYKLTTLERVPEQYRLPTGGDAA